jgi:predicted esterase
VLVSHGTHDPILPFEGAERLAAALTDGGLEVDFVRFRGQHEIPPVVLEHASALIRRVAG